MSALASLQRAFYAELAGDGPCTEGMEAYRRGMRESHHGALAAAYPVVRRLVGEAFFREAAARHDEAHPSASGDLHEYGAHFAPFLARYRFAASEPYLPDVARLEWALHECEYAADVPPLDFAALARLPAEAHAALRFELHPALRLVASDHPVLALWEANRPGRDGTPQRHGPERVLVARIEGTARARAVDEAEWRFLESLARGESLAEAYDCLGEEPPESIGTWLACYARDGIVSAFRSPAGP
jgi:putative DNA-binding protein